MVKRRVLGKGVQEGPQHGRRSRRSSSGVCLLARQATPPPSQRQSSPPVTDASHDPLSVNHARASMHTPMPPSPNHARGHGWITVPGVLGRQQRTFFRSSPCTSRASNIAPLLSSNCTTKPTKSRCNLSVSCQCAAWRLGVTSALQELILGGGDIAGVCSACCEGNPLLGVRAHPTRIPPPGSGHSKHRAPHPCVRLECIRLCD